MRRTGDGDKLEEKGKQRELEIAGETVGGGSADSEGISTEAEEQRSGGKKIGRQWDRQRSRQRGKKRRGNA